MWGLLAPRSPDHRKDQAQKTYLTRRMVGAQLLPSCQAWRHTVQKSFSHLPHVMRWAGPPWVQSVPNVLLVKSMLTAQPQLGWGHHRMSGSRMRKFWSRSLCSLAARLGAKNLTSSCSVRVDMRGVVNTKWADESVRISKGGARRQGMRRTEPTHTGE